MAEIQKIYSEISELLNAKTEDLRGALLQELKQRLEAGMAASGASSTDQLNSAIETIQQLTAQTDVLRALLDGAARFAGRVALFIVKGAALNGWQSRGFADEDALKTMTLDATKGLAGSAIRDCKGTAAAAQDFDAQLIRQQGAPSEGNAWLLPLIVRDKVAALLYCDAGKGRVLDSSALQVLVRATGQWLEILAARKATGSTAAESPVAAPASMPAPSAPARVVPSAPAAEASLDHLPPEEKDLHVKARRFAKLLVDEIRLYNQAKVNEGRQNRSVYQLLREDIEKSRETYNKRYGGTSVAAAGYFSREVVRILADNDASLLGSDFPG
jgi:hypothetical protein